MHAQAHKMLTYYTVTGHETLRIYNDTEGYGPYVIMTPDGRQWTRRGVPELPPEGFAVQPGEFFLAEMTPDDAFELATEIADREWEDDPRTHEEFETKADLWAATVQGLMREIERHQAPILAVRT